MRPRVHIILRTTSMLDKMSSQIIARKNLVQWEELFLGGFGAACAGVFTNPLEVNVCFIITFI